MTAIDWVLLRRQCGRGFATALVATAWMAAIAWTGPAALAHTDEYFDAHPSPHGGQVRMSGPYHLELVAGADELVVYVTDHANNEISSEGAKGSATISSGGATKTAGLVPAGGNRFKAKLDAAIGPETTIAVAVTMPGEPTAEASFVPGAARRSSESDKPLVEPHAGSHVH